MGQVFPFNGMLRSGLRWNDLRVQFRWSCIGGGWHSHGVGIDYTRRVEQNRRADLLRVKYSRGAWLNGTQNTLRTRYIVLQTLNRDIFRLGYTRIEDLLLLLVWLRAADLAKMFVLRHGGNLLLEIWGL